MSIELPGFLTDALSRIGMDWPQADEDALFHAAGVWSSYADQLRQVEQTTTTTAQEVWNVNTGAAADAFRTWWSENPSSHLKEDATGAEMIGSTLTIFGGATIALKGVYLVQLGILVATIAEAIATAFVTFGASLAEIPIITTIVRKVISTAVENMIYEVLF